MQSFDNANIELTSRCEAAFQHERLNQIIISGIPSSVVDENLEETACRILNEVKSFKVNERDIAACHRLGNKHETILRFVNRKDAEDSLYNRNKLKDLNGETVGLAEGKVDIYINPSLSPYMKKLAFYCRVLQRQNFVAKVTSYKGVVKIFREQILIATI